MDSPISNPPSSLQSSTRSRTRGEHSRRSHKDKSNLASASKELVRLLVHEEQETQELRNTLHDLTERLRDETQRADNAEQRARDIVVRFKEANDSLLAAKQENTRVSEELRLYKLQLENAQREISRAQELLDSVEAQRLEAEEAAARARTMARKLKEEKVVQLARDQGHVEGIKDGFERGKALGYEEGRAEGYSRGRAAATKECTQKGHIHKDEYSPPRTVESVTRNRPLAPPTPPIDSPPSGQMFTLPLQEAINVRPPPPSTTPPGPPPQSESRPISVYNVPSSPQHALVDYPPDGWIPVIDGDQRIRLPPPHELAPTPYSPRNSPPQLHQSFTLDPARESPALMIPPPLSRNDIYSDSGPTTGTRQRQPLKRRKSSDSASTTFSQFDLIGPPAAVSARSNQGSSRTNVLSAIVEERSPSATPSPYEQPRTATPVIPIPVPITMPTPEAPAPIPLERAAIPMQQHDYYTRPGSRSSPESVPRNTPSQDRQLLSPKGSVMSSNSFHIMVEPPSRPESGRSGIAFTQDNLLSANDAEHPPPTTAPQVAGNQEPAGQPIVLSSDQLPPGFVATGPALSSRMEPTQSPRQMAEKTSSTPAAPPSGSPSIYQFYASPTGGASTGGQQQPTPVVIPPPSHAGPRRYSRTALTRASTSESDEDHAVSSQISSSSMDSFTTPPERRKPLAPPSYAVAPTPPNVIYPMPAPRSGGSSSTMKVPLPASGVGSPHASVAAKVPLPQSSVGSPRSAYTHASRPGGGSAGSPSVLNPEMTGRSNQSTPPVMIPSGGPRS